MLTSMRKRVVVMVAAAALLGFAAGQVDTNLRAVFDAKPGSMTKAASDIVGGFQRQHAAARSAPQISQIADEANVALNYAIVKQNDEIIRLLKKIAGEK
jgi:uncharacterized protein YdeI (BOF family)